MEHIYLSPHLDDVVLSCGGLLHRQRSAGEPATVVTLCAGSPGAALSQLAQRYHELWDGGPDPVACRRAEDHAVLEALGVSIQHCEIPDAIYRWMGAAPAYAETAQLFAAPHAHETAELVARWEAELRSLCHDAAGVVVYAPLAAGNHVDHQLGRALGVRLLEGGGNVWFYEDFPHAESGGALDAAKASFGKVMWQSRTVPIDVRAKLAALRGYQTQVRFLFGSDAAMVQRVQRFTAEVACEISAAERLRRRLAGADGRRARLWRRVCGYHAHAERLWRPR